MLEVDAVEAAYDGVPALHGVSFRVERGQVVSIVGSNGAGKSTILRTISSILKPVAGEVRFEGRRIDGQPPHDVVALGIAHVPEGRRLFGRLSVLQNLLVGAYTRPSPPEREESLQKVFEMFPILRQRRSQKAGTLSGGEQQMLAIARGLMSRPRLLMLDEPSLGISPRLVDEIFERVREINSQGTTVLLVEQNVQSALSLADRAYVLQTGRVVLEGTGDELQRSDMVRSAYLGM